MEGIELKNPQKRTRKAARAALAVFLVALAAAGVWFVKAVDPMRSGLYPPCLFHAVTGLWCAGCGMARALHDLLNGHIWAAFRMNPLVVSALPLLLWALGLVFYRLWKKKPMPKVPSWIPWAAIALIVLYTVARNLPWMPFAWFAPTVIG